MCVLLSACGDAQSLCFKLLRLLVEKPACHFEWLAVDNRNDDVAVKRPRTRAIEFARNRRMIWMAVIEAYNEFATFGGVSFRVHQVLWCDRESTRSLQLGRVIMHGPK